MDIFRYALQKDEISERVFRLTKAVIATNNGNYTAWYFFNIQKIIKVCKKKMFRYIART